MDGELTEETVILPVLDAPVLFADEAVTTKVPPPTPDVVIVNQSPSVMLAFHPWESLVVITELPCAPLLLARLRVVGLADRVICEGVLTNCTIPVCVNPSDIAITLAENSN